MVAAEALRSFSDANAVPRNVLSFDDRRRTQVFLREHVPGTLAMGGYAALALLSTVAIPHLYGQVRHYHVATAYVFAPLLAFCNAYGTGLTDWSLASTYGKLAIFIFGAEERSLHNIQDLLDAARHTLGLLNRGRLP